MKRRVLKIAALIAALGLIAGVCLFANSLVGNPVSERLAAGAAENYIAENFPDGDFVLDRVTFSFKDIKYHAYISSPTSIDSSFSLTIDMFGRIVYDYYENSVLKGWNTAHRLGSEYRTAVAKVLDSPSFPYECEIGFGDLQFVPEEHKDEPAVPDYALITDELVPDAFYDIRELGAKGGLLTLYLSDDTVTAQRLGQILLEIKGIFDASGVGFHAIDCVLELPDSENGGQDGERVEVMGFLYSDIYEEDLTARVEASNAAAREYYNAMDKETQ